MKSNGSGEAPSLISLLGMHRDCFVKVETQRGIVCGYRGEIDLCIYIIITQVGSIWKKLKVVSSTRRHREIQN